MAKRPPAAQTAFGPMVIAAAEQYVPDSQRLVHDDLAAWMLPTGLGLVARACRWRPIRSALIKATESQATGLWGGMLCRKRYADEKVSEAITAGMGQVVFLGAGMDTRAVRLVTTAGVRAFEVDLPANIAAKEERLRSIYRKVPDQLSLVPIDFETDDLVETLTANGFQLGIPTMFVWEAVTQYLTDDGVKRTLASLRSCPAGSSLMFTYVRKDFLDGTNSYGAEKAYRTFVVKHRVWRFGLNPAGVEPLLHEFGWTPREQVGREEYLARYVAATGRDLPVSDLERFAYAEKL